LLTLGVGRGMHVRQRCLVSFGEPEGGEKRQLIVFECGTEICFLIRYGRTGTGAIVVPGFGTHP